MEPLQIDPATLGVALAILARWIGPDAVKLVRAASAKLNGGQVQQDETAKDILKDIRATTQEHKDVSDQMLERIVEVQKRLEVMDRVADRLGGGR